MLEKLVFAGNY